MNDRAALWEPLKEICTIVEAVELWNAFRVYCNKCASMVATFTPDIHDQISAADKVWEHSHGCYGGEAEGK